MSIFNPTYMNKFNANAKIKKEVSTMSKKNKNTNKNNNNGKEKSKDVLKIVHKHCNTQKYEPVKVEDKESTWSTKLTVHEKCPYQKTLTVAIHISSLEFLKSIDKKVKGREFGVFFNGKYINDDLFSIEKMIVPEQTTTFAHIEYDEETHADGTIHKHPSGMKTPSRNDEEFCNGNHDINMIFCDDEIVFGIARFKTKCGCFISRDVKALIIYDIDYSKIEENAIAAVLKIKEKEYVYEKNVKKSIVQTNFFRKDKTGTKKDIHPADLDNAFDNDCNIVRDKYRFPIERDDWDEQEENQFIRNKDGFVVDLRDEPVSTDTETMEDLYRKEEDTRRNKNKLSKDKI